PLLASTGSQITDSARSRAFRMRKHPIKSIQIISVGLVNSIVSFADDVSMAMQNRGYTGVGWTSMNELKFKKRDALFFCVFIFIIGAIVAAVGHQYAMMASGFAAMASSVMVMALV
ncbi:MAG: energy-coupling factor transporter transmembrane protein EcfT, partial [Methanimicrococcus sp.]|nr:energy-coupling factor transporter transmembrane protein EcfT [Methanimicrococcus sp.]